ncbi:RNA polymerase sigma factor [Patiriisocius hiemis]|uniref:Sigma-70 family RNA polymerase sigma factor n=1 Tax=Patiriisocius hiemis TaxID=3075604 RepID=A0ABU2YE80_9FLAO|nr:sigma-70 family RNA polymerase sigma factor [Constantimarinum sp. W242]MDT0556317.1 sigma-70 family RNA polymerase sigma factor [Constantimarinum sp. W242]
MGKVLQIQAQDNIVVAIQNNNEQLLKQLYQDNYKKIEYYVLQNSGSIDQAKDLYQEAFLSMWKNVKEDKFVPKNETALQGYLYTIAKNKWTDYLRSARFKKTTGMPGNFQIKENEEDNSYFENETNNKQSLVSIAFKKLGEECKTVLKQFYFEKKSLKEIALQFNIGENSVRNKKYRCIQKLKKLTITPK